MELVIIAVVVGYLLFHAGHAHANYRHGRRHGRRGIGLVWYAGRGPWISVPGPFGTRIGHKLDCPACLKSAAPGPGARLIFESQT
jgi:hypothetical protein